MNKPLLHTTLNKDEWTSQDIFSTMGNIGSEVSRAIKWKNKGKEEKFLSALYRSIELFNLSVENSKITSSQLGELLRAKEVWLDFIFGNNEYGSNEQSIQKYFDQFALANRNINY